MCPDWKKYNQSQLGKEKVTFFDLFVGKTNFSPVFSVSKWVVCIKSKTKEDFAGLIKIIIIATFFS